MRGPGKILCRQSVKRGARGVHPAVDAPKFIWDGRRGGDLLALGLEGPAVGAALQELLELVMDETLPNDRDILLEHVKEKL